MLTADQTYTIGIDFHQNSSAVCILGEDGAVVKETNLRKGINGVAQWVIGLGVSFQVAFEASTGSGFLFDALRPHAERVDVANPRKLHLIYRSSRKTDRNDAMKLAEMAFFDRVPTVYMPAKEVRDWRALIERRKSLVKEATRVKCRIRATARANAWSLPPGRGLWSAKGLAFLRTLEIESRTFRFQVHGLIRIVEHLHREIAAFDEELDAIAARKPAVALLMSIPGIGPRTAEAFVAYVDDPNRFPTAKSIGAYFGLVPRQDSSGDKVRRGSITNEGPGTVRGLLTESTWQLIRRDAGARAFFERIWRQDPSRRKKAIVATAHRLARCMLAMMKTGEVWRITPTNEEVAAA